MGAAMATCGGTSRGAIRVGVARCVGVWSTVTVAVLFISLSILEAAEQIHTKMKQILNLITDRGGRCTCFDDCTLLHVPVPVLVLAEASTVASLVAATAGFGGLPSTIPAVLGRKNIPKVKPHTTEVHRGILKTKG